ncbi:MAG TPA: 50S ribosomal protein L6 [Caldisericia bacterium]|nr:50S ribosomal protein L6 [Caldisericia bacterium]HQL66601.1 50S ribosomal protein L6 [Caldisericia bacterium]HQO99846.1 50S ribosomal protein L6 [Caldisericia bacterium]
MSKIGRKPIEIPKDISVELKENFIIIKGKKIEFKKEIPDSITVKVVDSQIVVERKNDLKETKALHGTYRALINNMITGLTKGFEKVLLLHGVGYKANLQGKKLVIYLGYTHPTEIEPPPGIEFVVEKDIRITVKGYDKELVGKIAAYIRRLRDPDPYKAKGVRYEDEVIRRKAGKALTKGT